MRHVLVVLGLLALSPLASAAALVTVQGRLLNLANEGVDGDYAMTFKLYETATGGSPVWQEILPSVTVNDGVFSAVLGNQIAFDANVVDRPGLWLEIAVAGEQPLTREPLTATPKSVVAERTHDLACTGCVSPEETTFMAACTDGQILRKTGGTWGCVDLVIPTYSGANFALSDQLCGAGQLMRGIKADGMPNCIADKDTTYSGANFAVSGQGCGAGQVMTGVGSDGTPTCAPDKDTTYSGANFALSSKSCAAGQVQRGVDSSGNPICVTDAVNTYTGTDFALSNKACTAGQVVTGIKADGTPNCVANPTYDGGDFAVSNTACPAGQVMKGVLATGQPSCVADANTTYVGSSRVDLQACKLEYSIVSPK